jgi:ATP-dependent Clp protease adaptor protein ClpS
MSDVVTKPRVKVKPKVERPKLHKVILVNDDYTPREFVVTVLKGEFHMSEDQAYKVMITAHRRGVCVVAVFTKDVAETKATRATEAGRAKDTRCSSPPSRRSEGSGLPLRRHEASVRKLVQRNAGVGGLGKLVALAQLFKCFFGTCRGNQQRRHGRLIPNLPVFVIEKWQ